ncbi:type II secretion system F family protein [bacterium]|nr:type II secretion system F family protein [bacterium]
MIDGINISIIIDALIFTAMAGAIFFIVLYILPDEKQAAIRRRLGVVEKNAMPQNTALLKYLYPFYSALSPLLYLNHHSPVAKLWANYLQKEKKRLDPMLTTANLRNEISPDEFIAMRFVLILLMPLIIAMLFAGLNSEQNGFVLLLAAILGFYFPDIWLKQIIDIRKKSLLKHLPTTIDLLTLSVESGLDFMDAIARLTRKTQSNPLTVELQSMLREIRLGATRSEALRKMSAKLQLEELTSLTTLLIQTDQLGASIGDVLRAQSDQLRSKRFQMAEVAGAKASQLILLPLVFCILPAAICILLGPAVLNFLRGGFL